MGFWGPGPLENDLGLDWFDNYGEQEDFPEHARVAISVALAVQESDLVFDSSKSIAENSAHSEAMEQLSVGLAAIEAAARSVESHHKSNSTKSMPDKLLVLASIQLILKIDRIGWPGSEGAGPLSDWTDVDSVINNLLERLLGANVP